MGKSISLLVIVALLLSLTVSGQNLSKLDNNNGFKKFKFGMSSNQIPNLKISTSYNMQLRDVTYFKYEGNDIKDFSGVKIDEITLAFYKNKLYQIHISFGTINRKYTDGEYDIVDYALRANFGNNVHNCENSSTMEKLNCQIWDAQKVRLEHIRFNLSEADGTRKAEFNYIQGYILFNNKPMEKKQQNSELEN